LKNLKKLINFGPHHPDSTATHHGHSYEWDYISSENERLQNKVLIIQAEYDLEKTKSEQLKEAYVESKREIENFKNLIEEIETASKSAIKLENEGWQNIVQELRSVNENEIIRKQEEINKLHDILARWTFKFMELQEQKGHAPSHHENILYETYKRKEIPTSSLLYRALGLSPLSPRKDVEKATRVGGGLIEKKL